MDSLLFWGGLLALVALASVAGLQSIPLSEYRRRVQAIAALWPTNNTVSIVGATSTSNAITGTSTITGIFPGMTVSGTHIAPGTTVVSTDEALTKVTITPASTGTGTMLPFTFQWLTSAAKVHLISAPIAVGNDPIPSDFTEATFTGYAAIAISNNYGPYTASDGGGEIDFGDIAWVLSSIPATGNTIYGYWIDYPYPAGSGTRVVACWEPFLPALPMTTTGQAVVLSIPLKDPNPGSAAVIG